MNDELKSLIEDAAKLLGEPHYILGGVLAYKTPDGFSHPFNPLDPERGDLMKVAEAAELVVGRGLVINSWAHNYTVTEEYDPTDHESKVLAILRAASAVLHSRGGV